MVYILKMKTITLGRIYQMKLKKKKKKNGSFILFFLATPGKMYVQAAPQSHE